MFCKVNSDYLNRRLILSWIPELCFFRFKQTIFLFTSNIFVLFCQKSHNRDTEKTIQFANVAVT